MNRDYDWHLFVTPGLGDNSYLLHSGEEAVVIDPQRDAWRFLSEAASRKLKIRYVLETHVHNDYLSGALEIRNAARAEIAAPAKGNYEFPHRDMAEGDEIRIGTLRLVCIETPGHSPEHIAWLVYKDGSSQPVAVFSGGSLLVGSAGRTDLLGRKWTQRLTGMQFRTMRRFAELPPSVLLLPTHGAGSFCTATAAGTDRISTLNDQLQTNPALQLQDEALFAEHQLKNLKEYPTYYAHMAPINRTGPEILGSLPVPIALTVPQFEQIIAGGGWIIDARDRKSFAEAHIPGSINIELSDDFATYAGWLIPFGSVVGLVVVEPPEESLKEAVTQLIRIGYENIPGYLAGGFASWESSQTKVRSYPIGTLDDLCREYKSGTPNLIDVRQKTEWDEGHAEGSTHAFVGDLPNDIGQLSRIDTNWVACASGFRASIAASYLDRAGIPVRLLVEDGIPRLLECCPQARSSSK